jgi:hypothetical protein
VTAASFQSGKNAQLRSKLAIEKLSAGKLSIGTLTVDQLTVRYRLTGALTVTPEYTRGRSMNPGVLRRHAG